MFVKIFIQIQKYCTFFRMQEIPSSGFSLYRGADKSLALPGRKQATATEGFDFHISYL